MSNFLKTLFCLALVFQQDVFLSSTPMPAEGSKGSSEQTEIKNGFNLPVIKHTTTNENKSIPETSLSNNTTSADSGMEDECVCSNHSSHLSTRIVNGDRTDLNEYPFTVSLLIRSNEASSLCGGSLISSAYILTAAHCVTSKEHRDTVNAEHVKISVGKNNVDVTLIETTFSLTASAVMVHPLYKKDFFSNDIALIRLKDELSLNERVNLVCLPTSHLSYAGLIATVIGWGRTSAFGSISTQQMEADVPIWNQQECKEKWETANVKITSSMICAGGQTTDSCSGDSGGPMVIKEDGRITILGIVSFGLEICAYPGWPSVYTKVSSFIDWIEENTVDSPPC